MLKIKMPMISKAVLIIPVLINKPLHMKSGKSKVLRTGASRLSTILCHLFDLSPTQEKVPTLQKTSGLVSVPKVVMPL